MFDTRRVGISYRNRNLVYINVLHLLTFLSPNPDIEQLRGSLTRLQQTQNSLSDDVEPLKDTSRKHSEDINTAKEDVSQLKGTNHLDQIQFVNGKSDEGHTGGEP